MEPDKINKEILKRFLVTADIKALLCIDERGHEKDPDDDHHSPENRHGINLPGGIFGVVEAVKVLRNTDEETAWKIVVDAKIPLWGHDDNHKGVKGCGYEGLIEDEYKTVLAKEAVSAEQRMTKLRLMGGLVLRYLGHHDHNGSVINRVKGMTIDQEAAAAAGVRVFACDSWIANEWGPLLGIDPKKLMEYWENVHNMAVERLTRDSRYPIKEAIILN